jgi:hypothetical protein
LALVNLNKAKEEAKTTRAERKETKAKLDKLKPLAKVKAECQQAINALVREEEKDLPCISCGRFHQGQWHAGHYLSVGARPGLRFTRNNLAKQCQPCNVHLSGNLINYRIGLIKRIGLEAVEALENDHAPPRHYTREQLIEMTKDARKSLRKLQTRDESET